MSKSVGVNGEAEESNDLWLEDKDKDNDLRFKDKEKDKDL